MVDPLESETVEIEDVVSVVYVGDAGVEFKNGAFANREFTFNANVESVVAGQSTAIELGINDSIFAIDEGVVGGDALAEGDVFKHALSLCVGESAAEAPATADFPLVFFAKADGGEEVDGVAAIVVRGVGLDIIGAVYPSKGIGGPDVKPFNVVAETEVETVSDAFFKDEVGEEVFRFFVDASGSVCIVAAVVHLVAVGVEELAEVFQIEFGIGGEMVGEVVFSAENEMLSALDAAVNFVVNECFGFVDIVVAD